MQMPYMPIFQYFSERKPKNAMSPPPTIRSISSQFDAMRHKLLSTRLEEAGERPQEVPQSADPLNTSSSPGKYIGPDKEIELA